MILLWTTAAVVAGFIIDLIAGDPRWLYHRKWHFAGRKTVAEDFSENKDRGTGSRCCACPACDGHIRGRSTGRADFAL